MLGDEWLYRKSRQKQHRAVTIRSGVQVRQKMHKAPGGLIRATVEVQDGVLAAVALSGDFFLYPAERLSDLESALLGVRLEEAEAAIGRFYEQHAVESPGVVPADLARVLV